MDAIEYLRHLGPRLLSTEEVATLLGVHYETLMSWTREGRITHYRVGNRVKFAANDVLHFLEQRTVVRPTPRKR